MALNQINRIHFTSAVCFTEFIHHLPNGATGNLYILVLLLQTASLLLQQHMKVLLSGCPCLELRTPSGPPACMLCIGTVCLRWGHNFSLIIPCFHSTHFNAKYCMSGWLIFYCTTQHQSCFYRK